jgi:hypothetical protein
MNNLDESCLSLFSAFFIAEYTILYNISAHFLGANLRNFKASSTFSHLTTSAITLSFLGEILMFFP